MCVIGSLWTWISIKDGETMLGEIGSVPGLALFVFKTSATERSNVSDYSWANITKWADLFYKIDSKDNCVRKRWGFAKKNLWNKQISRLRTWGIILWTVHQIKDQNLTMDYKALRMGQVSNLPLPLLTFVLWRNLGKSWGIREFLSHTIWLYRRWSGVPKAPWGHRQHKKHINYHWKT